MGEVNRSNTTFEKVMILFENKRNIECYIAKLVYYKEKLTAVQINRAGVEK